ncbi:hypothetical protein MLD38_020883 [Melastoma candidum]|uniref:Uncharacterized protein n=1 Tax=Melastoma candidum TaxID=119954 RepID=A0ACB9QEN3_9MYRT|nr:hypothetical protein MLD38_020883 [Melastoma candidum]
MLFELGLISLFAWHVASGIEWYSQRRLGLGSPYLRLAMTALAILDLICGSRPIQSITTDAVEQAGISHMPFIPMAICLSPRAEDLTNKGREYELSEIRKQWTNLPDLSPDVKRSRSECLLAPHEVGLMLRGLGF